MSVLEKVAFLPGWEIRARPLIAANEFSREASLIYWAFPCLRSNEGEYKGRKWYISPYATDSEIVLTAFKAAATALEHEAREAFLYKGQAILGPHFDVDFLVAAIEKTGNLALDVRHESPVEEAPAVEVSLGQRWVIREGGLALVEKLETDCQATAWPFHCVVETGKYAGTRYSVRRDGRDMGDNDSPLDLVKLSDVQPNWSSKRG